MTTLSSEYISQILSTSENFPLVGHVRDENLPWWLVGRHHPQGRGPRQRYVHEALQLHLWPERQKYVF